MLMKAENYNYAVSVLQEIKKIVEKNKWTDEWNNQYKAFLERHKRKKLLLKALEDFQP